MGDPTELVLRGLVEVAARGEAWKSMQWCKRGKAIEKREGGVQPPGGGGNGGGDLAKANAEADKAADKECKQAAKKAAEEIAGKTYTYTDMEELLNQGEMEEAKKALAGCLKEKQSREPQSNAQVPIGTKVVLQCYLYSTKMLPHTRTTSPALLYSSTRVLRLH